MEAKMNSKGSIMLAFLVVVLLIILVVFALVGVFKETLDANRGSDTLNCIGTDSFNRTAYDQQTTTEKLTYRTTCFVTGISLSYFVLMVIGSAFIWLYRNWRRR
jgi:hypothetical protein